MTTRGKPSSKPPAAPEAPSGSFDESAVDSPRRELLADVTTASRNRLHVDERRAQLLKLGQEMFSARGYDELSIDEIARAANISKGLLYHYFPSKRNFYVEVIRSSAMELTGAANPPEGGDLRERLAQGVDSYLDYVQNHARPFACLLRSAVGFDPEVRNIVEDTRQAFLTRLLGALPDPTPAMRNALRGWIGFAEGASLDWIDNKDISRAELRSVLIQMAFQIIGVVSGGGGGIGLPPAEGGPAQDTSKAPKSRVSAKVTTRLSRDEPALA
ncbi:MAG TPA: TetR/AcrR family transcriptional regulator [Polyangiaceae bacterium]|nr:TetR/AcrR family transcriptional regulator [Polyangiaceae bacterium]